MKVDPHIIFLILIFAAVFTAGQAAIGACFDFQLPQIVQGAGLGEQLLLHPYHVRRDTP